MCKLSQLGEAGTLVSNIAADELAAELIGGAHDRETAGCRIDHEVAAARDRLDELGD
jgi:hypothetical protein